MTLSRYQKALKQIRGGLSKREQKPFDAIRDPMTHATISADLSNDSVDIGSSITPGVNGIDQRELELLDNSNVGLSAADVVKHEAYQMAKDIDFNTAHLQNPFPGLVGVSAETVVTPNARGTHYTGAVLSFVHGQDIKVPGGTMTEKKLWKIAEQLPNIHYRVLMTKTFNTPIPVNGVGGGGGESQVR
jgi:hypothetical protein